MRRIEERYLIGDSKNALHRRANMRLHAYQRDFKETLPRTEKYQVILKTNQRRARLFSVSGLCGERSR